MTATAPMTPMTPAWSHELALLMWSSPFFRGGRGWERKQAFLRVGERYTSRSDFVTNAPRRWLAVYQEAVWQDRRAARHERQRQR